MNVNDIIKRLGKLDLSGLVPEQYKAKAKAVAAAILVGVPLLVSFAVFSPDQGTQITELVGFVLTVLGVHQTVNKKKR